MQPYHFIGCSYLLAPSNGCHHTSNWKIISSDSGTLIRPLNQEPLGGVQGVAAPSRGALKVPEGHSAVSSSGGVPWVLCRSSNLPPQGLPTELVSNESLVNDQALIALTFVSGRKYLHALCLTQTWLLMKYYVLQLRVTSPLTLT